MRDVYDCDRLRVACVRMRVFHHAELVCLSFAVTRSDRLPSASSGAGAGGFELQYTFGESARALSDAGFRGEGNPSMVEYPTERTGRRSISPLRSVQLVNYYDDVFDFNLIGFSIVRT